MMQDLKRQPRTILLTIAVDLDPDAVAEAYEEGWTKEDLVDFISKHAQSAVGRRDVEGGEYVGPGGVSVIDAEIEDE